MTPVWIGLGAAALLAASAWVALLGRRRARAPATVLDLVSSTSVDRDTGAVRSAQRADLLLDDASLAAIWSPEHLERLARTYWRFLARITLGLIHVHYTDSERSVVLLLPTLKLLTFQAPEYEMDASRGLVRWRIASGLLVSRRGRGGRGHLQIEVRRRPGPKPGRTCLHVEVEVANFYPSIASRLGRRIYDATQSRIHVIVTYAFLRSLARLDLAKSRVGRMAAPGQQR